MHPSKLIVAALASFSLCAASLPAENLPDIRPAMIGSGPGSLVNLIDAQALFQKGQRDAWVMLGRQEGSELTIDTAGLRGTPAGSLKFALEKGFLVGIAK